MLILTVDDHAVRASLGSLPLHLQRAAVSAVTKTMRMARTAADRDIRDLYTIKLRDLRAAVRFIPATTRRPAASITASSRLQKRGGRIALIKFAGAVSRRSVKVQVRKDRSPQLLGQAFVGRTKSGHRGIFQRAFRGQRQVLSWYRGIGPHRGGGKSQHKTAELPIVELYGPSVVTLYRQPTVFARIKAVIQANYARLLKHEMAYFRGRKG